MRISYQYIFTHSSLIVVTIVVVGCAPEGDLVNTTPEPGRPVTPSGNQAPSPPLPALSGAPYQEPPLSPGPDHGDPSGEGTPDMAAPLVLFRNVPNPFNPATRLSFAVPESGGKVTLVIHGVDGRRVRNLVGSDLRGGEYTVTWFGRDDSGRRLPSGVYFASLSSGGEVRTRKLVMVQ